MANPVLNIDYLQEKNSLTKLYIADLSSYYSYNPATHTPTIEITAPGFTKVALDFTPNSVNIFTASNLNVDCASDSTLPDGVYTVRYSISPSSTYNVEKTFIRVTAIKCKYARLFLGIDMDCACGQSKQTQLKAQLRDAKEMIEGAIAASNQGDVDSAMDLYKLADKALDRIQPCNC
jgi:hypothetical protein